VISKYGFVGGGKNNLVSKEFAVISGGLNNTANGWYATIAGGRDNTADDYGATISGGNNNTSSGISSVICGGEDNTCISNYSVISGGWSNTVSGGGAYAAIGGGYNNCAEGSRATIAGGFNDTVIADYGACLSGYDNKSGDESTDTAVVVVGGKENEATAKYSAIVGGLSNQALGDFNFIGGGERNLINTLYGGEYATIGGGLKNTIMGSYGTICGGLANGIGGGSSVICGGDSNDISVYAPWNVISGGKKNKIKTSAYGAIPGGRGDTIEADYGFATGYSSYVENYNSAAFTGSHTIAQKQVRAQQFSSGTFIFSMDHPLDPMHKILNQYAVGSDEVLFFYRGEAILDDEGRAVVHLPGYFEAITTNPMIQLTGVGNADVFVAEDIRGNSFTIGGRPGTKVYWTVTAERKDIYARIARILTPVEQVKTGHLIGHSLDDDALIGVYDRVKKEGPFHFRTEEGRRSHEEFKRSLLERR